MPPASITKRKQLGVKRLLREVKVTTEFQDEFLQSQLGKIEDLTDVLLKCNDGGSIPVHSALMQAVSPLFQKCLLSQGELYFMTREVILPDFTTSDIKNLIQLLYTGNVQLSSEDEVKCLQQTLEFFEIQNLNNFKVKRNNRRTHTGQKIQEIRFQHSKKKFKLLKKKQGKRNYNDSDWEPDTDESSEKVAPKPEVVAKILQKPRLPNGNSNSKAVTKKAAASDDNDDLDWTEPDYNDKAWFDKEARRCQFCKKDHDNPAQASMCITGHQRLRCYFCFKVCANTEKLFEHFKTGHKQAGRENCLLCPYCEQTIPFKSVSCHVISLHLSETKTPKSDDKAKSTASAKAGSSGITVLNKPRGVQVKGADLKRMPVVVLTKTKHLNSIRNGINKEPNPPPNKKSRVEADHAYIEDNGLIRARNLDVTISKKGLDGKLWTWRVQKDYSRKAHT